MYDCVPYANKGLFTLGGTLGDARITVPMTVKGNVLGLAKLREQVILQPNTQQIVGQNFPKINNQSVYLLESIVHKDTCGFLVQGTIFSTKGWHHCQLWNATNDSITLKAGTTIGQLAPLLDIVSIAQENSPGADMGTPCYFDGEEQGDNPKLNGHRNRYRRYSADRVRASSTNFLSDRNRYKTQNFIQGFNVLRKMTGKEVLKIIIIKIIAIHLLLNL